MPRTRTRFPTELLVQLQRDDPLPLHRQLEQELRGAIRAGRLGAETALPSTRVLADQLELSRGVVVEAYEQLVAEGYLTSLPRWSDAGRGPRAGGTAAHRTRRRGP